MTKVNLREAKSNLSKLVKKPCKEKRSFLPKVVNRWCGWCREKVTKGPLGLHATQLSDSKANEAMKPLTDNKLGFAVKPF